MLAYVVVDGSRRVQGHRLFEFPKVCDDLCGSRWPLASIRLDRRDSFTQSSTTINSQWQDDKSMSKQSTSKAVLQRHLITLTCNRSPERVFQRFRPSSNGFINSLMPPHGVGNRLRSHSPYGHCVGDGTVVTCNGLPSPYLRTIGS